MSFDHILQAMWAHYGIPTWASYISYLWTPHTHIDLFLMLGLTFLNLLLSRYMHTFYLWISLNSVMDTLLTLTTGKWLSPSGEVFDFQCLTLQCYPCAIANVAAITWRTGALHITQNLQWVHIQEINLYRFKYFPKYTADSNTYHVYKK